MTSANDAAGSPRRILIIEDEVLIGVLLEDMLMDLGYQVVDTVARIEDAMARVAASDFDAAVLDLNLTGQSSLPVADILISRNVPLIFVTGYGAQGLPARYQTVPVLQKPFRQEDLERHLKAVFAGA